MSLTSCSSDYKFQYWQAEYAAHGIATIPVHPDKVPMVKGAGRFGLSASAEIARKFPDALGFGFMAGRRNRITVLDIDTPDENVLADALNRYGQTPIIVRSGSGNHHGWYRHGGERRDVKAEAKIDILGGGLVVAPPSQTAKGRYQFIQGGLDDLDRLSLMLNVPQLRIRTSLAFKKEGDGRNAELFRIVGRAAHHADDYDQLLDYARTQNDSCAEPMRDEEVTKIAGNVWKMQCEGRNRFGTHGAWFPLALSRKLARANPDAYALYGVLRAENGPDSIFPIANAMAKTVTNPGIINLGWRRLAEARKVIIGLGLVEEVSPQTRHKPALYRWPNRDFFPGNEGF
jgi:hypothetical protein